jgi:hypothetical protein
VVEDAHPTVPRHAVSLEREVHFLDAVTFGAGAKRGLGTGRTATKEDAVCRGHTFDHSRLTDVLRPGTAAGCLMEIRHEHAEPVRDSFSDDRVSRPATSGQGWPEWRGPGRAAVLVAGQAPVKWPASFAPAWKVEVGEGYASPVVGGGLAFVHSRQDPQEVVTAIDIATGKVRWREAYQAPFNKNGYAVKMGKGPNATPLLAGGRLFVLGASGHFWRSMPPAGNACGQRTFRA